MPWARKTSKGWRPYWRDANKQTRSAQELYRRKSDAERAAAVEEDKSRKSRLNGDDKTTWGDWHDVWMHTRTVEPSTLKRDVERIEAHVRPRWGDVPLTAITRHDVKLWAAELADGRKPNTVKRIVDTLSASLNAAVDAELMDGNPAAHLKLGDGQATHERFLTRDELDKVCHYLNEPWRTITYFLANTGLRWGEAAGVTWKRVDLDRGTILVAEVWDESNQFLKSYPKGRKRRTVPLPDWLGSMLPAGDPVLTTTRGGHMVLRTYTRALDAARKQARVEPFRVHDLRHTYASWLLQAGVPLAEVGRLLGHTSTQTTARYAHLAEAPSDEVLSVLKKPAIRTRAVR